MKEAEIIALDVLAFLAGEPDRFRSFLAQTGLDHHELKARAAAPDFLAGVLDYLLSDEKLLLQFTQNERISPQIIVEMRRNLPGSNAL